MDYEDIRRCLTDCRFTDHARREMEAESLGVIRVDEVLQVLEIGEIIEEYSQGYTVPQLPGPRADRPGEAAPRGLCSDSR